jgi:hypothetical protein
MSTASSKDGFTFKAPKVKKPPKLKITTVSLKEGEENAPYTETLTATGAKASELLWQLSTNSSLPAGLILTQAGVIEGEPALGTVGESSFEVTVTSKKGGKATATLSLKIAKPVVITTKSLKDPFLEEHEYAEIVQVAGGVGPYYRWTLSHGSLPSGLELDPRNGYVYGVPTAVGTSEFEVTVEDEAGGTAQMAYTITVRPLSFPKSFSFTYDGHQANPGRFSSEHAGEDITVTGEQIGACAWSCAYAFKSVTGTRYGYTEGAEVGDFEPCSYPINLQSVPLGENAELRLRPENGVILGKFVLPRGAIYSEQAHCFSLFSVETPKAIGSAEASELTQELAYGAATSSWTLVDWTVEEEVSPDTVTISWTWG